MPLTYNKVIQLSREFQVAHHMLNHFGNGADYNTVLENTVGGIHYPIMYMEDLAMPLQQGVEVMSFRVGFLALVEQLEDRETSLISANRNEVISDMMSCAKDFVAYWVQDHAYDDFKIQKVAPRNTVEDVTPDKLWGCYVDITFEQAFRYDKCAIPMSGVTPPPSTDVIITINSASYSVVACGETVNIPVVDMLGNPVGSKIGDDWVVNTSGDPVSNSMNGAALTDAVAGTTKTFVVTYADLSPVVVTETSDSATAFVGTVPNPVVALNSAIPYKSGATNSYYTNDDGDSKYGRGSDFWNLDIADYPDNNFFGNLKRFTGTTGGYEVETIPGTWEDLDGNSTTEALAFPNDIVVDNATWNKNGGSIIMWYRLPSAAINGQTAIETDAPSKAYGGFSGWRVPNLDFSEMIYNNDVASTSYYVTFNYPPFNLDQATYSLFWTCQPARLSGRLIAVNPNGSLSPVNATTAGIVYFPFRVGNISEL